MSEIVSQLESILSDITATEMRIAASIALVLTGVILGWVVIPWLGRWFRRFLDGVIDRHMDEEASAYRDDIVQGLPIAELYRLVLGLIRLAILGAAGIGVLVVWEQIEVALLVVGFVADAFPIGIRFLITVGLLVLAYTGLDLLENLVTEFSKDSDRVTAHQEQLLTRVIQVSLIVLVAVTILGVWEINLGGLFVGAGFLGIVLGLAAQQTLGSLIAGFVLMFSRPFEIGDWVELGDEEGFVTDITIMNTYLRNFDGEFLVIPNDNVTDEVITNRTREGKIRIHVEVGIDYEDDPERAAEIALEAIRSIDKIPNNPSPQVTPQRFGDSAVVLDVLWWIDPPRPQHRRQTKAAVIKEIRRRFAEEDISIPFPQRVISDREPPFELDGTIATTRSDG